MGRPKLSRDDQVAESPQDDPRPLVTKASCDKRPWIAGVLAIEPCNLDKPPSFLRLSAFGARRVGSVGVSVAVKRSSNR
jgi:hypothetical protein